MELSQHRGSTVKVNIFNSTFLKLTIDNYFLIMVKLIIGTSRHLAAYAIKKTFFFEPHTQSSIRVNKILLNTYLTTEYNLTCMPSLLKQSLALAYPSAASANHHTHYHYHACFQLCVH